MKGSLPACPGHRQQPILPNLRKQTNLRSRHLPNAEFRICSFLHREPGLYEKAIFAATSAAAAIIIALVATATLKSQDEKYTIGIQELAQEMFRQEAETLMLFEEDDQYMINNVKAITNEAIPLSEQLPSELSPAQRAEILREYYKAKTAVLKTIKTLYAQSGQPIE